MNEDDLYVEISLNDYYDLKDKSGYYTVIYTLTKIVYYKDDQLHRLNGPAYIEIDEKNEYYAYYQNDQRHKLDGPAYIDELNKIYRYYINNKQYTKEEYYQHPDVIQYRLQKFQELIK